MKLLFRYLLIIIFAINTPNIWAQNISGRIIGAESNNPVVGVTITIAETNYRAISDVDGNYTLGRLLPGTYTIQYAFLGLTTVNRTVSIKADADELINISMQTNVRSIAEVTVISRGDRHNVREAKRQGVPVSVIDGKAIAGRGASITDVLNHQTGVKIRQTGSTGSDTKINVRGLEGNRVQIYMDGYALNTPDGSFSVNDIPLQFIDRIEIYKGIVPPEFGGDGLGSAINIVTIEPEESYFDIWSSYKSYGVYEGSAVYKHYFPKAKMYSSLFFGWSSAKNNYKVDSPYVEGLKITRDHDRYKKYDGALAFDFKDTWFDELVLENAFYASNKQIQGIQTNIQHARTSGWIVAINPKLEKTGFFTSNLDMKLNAMAAFGVNQLQDTSAYTYYFDGTKRPNTYLGEIGSIPNLSDDKLQDYRSNINFKYHLSDRMKLNVNNDYRHVRNEFNDKEADRYLTTHNTVGEEIKYSGMKANVTTIITSLNLENKWFDDKLSTMLTGRNYYYNVKGNTVNLTYGTTAAITPANASKSNWGYSFATRYDFAENWLVKFALEHNYRLPRSEEILGDRVMIVANTELRPEQANNYNLGVMYNRSYARGSRIQIDANVYGMSVKDMMMTRATNGYMSYYNIGKALLYGADMELKWDINSDWFFMVNATYQKSIDKMRYNPGTNTNSFTYDKQMPHIPIFYMNWSLDYRKENLFGGKGQYTRFFYEGGYTDKYYYGYTLSANQSYEIPSTNIHSLGIEYAIRNRTIFFSGECRNIFDSHELTNMNYPLPGRLFEFKVRFTSLKW